MKFNEQVILDLAVAYTTDNTLAFDKFETLFSDLSQAEKDDVADILAVHGIALTGTGNDMVRAFAGEVTVNDEPLFDYSIFGGNDPADFAFGSKRGFYQENELLVKAAQEGNKEALDLLFRRNTGLVMDVARKYTGAYGNDLSTDDLYMEGCCGMMKAVEKFDYSLGFKFSTYARWWIRQAILREIGNNGYTIRIPIHMQEKMSKIAKIEEDLIRKGIPFAYRVPEIARQLQNNGMYITEDKVLECIQLSLLTKHCASLDMPIGEDGDSFLGDFVPADEKDNPEVILDRMTMRSDIFEVLETLSPREEKVIIMRNGLDGNGQRTLEEIGKEFNVTRERIRQIEAKAMRKLRHPSRSNKLRDYLNDIA